MTRWAAAALFCSILEASPAMALDEPPPAPPAKRERGAAFFHLGAQGQVVNVSLPDAKLDGGGSATAHVTGIGHSGGLSSRVKLAGALGGQTSGWLARIDGDLALGKAFYLGDSANLFVRGGGRVDLHADGELDATVYSLPSISGGLQLTSTSVVFELAPHAAMALWTLYGTGSGIERYRRSSTLAPLWGGSAILISQFGLFDVGLDRVEETGGLWAVRGRLCTIVADRFPIPITACAWGNYWTAAVGHSSGAHERRDVDSSAIGLGLGIGDVRHDPKPKR